MSNIRSPPPLITSYYLITKPFFYFVRPWWTRRKRKTNQMRNRDANVCTHYSGTGKEIRLKLLGPTHGRKDESIRLRQRNR